ncbi:MAG: redoxin [Puniceicoccaceae bacterium]|nr:MAG: redoxin [Puniceicoccaceae bacterium]
MHSHRLFFLGLAALLTLAVGFAEPRVVTPLEPGQPIPEFTLPGIDGRGYSLADFEDARLLVVVFLANHCPTVQAYEDRLIAMVEAYRDRGVAFIGISPNSPQALSLAELGYSDLGDTLDDMRLRAEHKGYNFPYLYDGDDHEVSLAFGPAATPHAFLFDQDRRLRYTGRIDDTENPYVEPRTTDLLDAIETVLAGGTIATKRTPTFGCSVKWSWSGGWARELERRWAALPVELHPIDEEGVTSLVANDSDKLRLINVWATWCGPCVMKFPELVETDRMYRGRAFELVTLSADPPGRHDRVLHFLREQQASNRNYLFDSEDKYALIAALDAEWQGALPYSLLVAPGGEIIRRYPGLVDALTIRRDIVGHLGRFYADDHR